MFGEFVKKQEFKEIKERMPTWVNVGEPSLTGLIEKGRPERKEVCEDQKIHDPEKGLFCVADGVSTDSGDVASFEVSRLLNEKLGTTLDQQVDTIVQNLSLTKERKNELIEALVQVEIRTALFEANASIQQKAQMDPDKNTASTTVSLAKLVAMPDGTQRLFFSNIGDSRIYFMRNKKMIRLSQDDNYVTQGVKENRISEEEARQIDQAGSMDELPNRLKFYFKNRHVVTRVIGRLDQGEINVKSINVLSGDKIMIVSGGVSDQLREAKLAFGLASQKEDRAAERHLQTLAEQMSLLGTDPRAKAHDISVVVHTVAQHGPDRSYLRHSPKTNIVEGTTSDMVEAWRKQIPILEKRIHAARQAGEDVEVLEQELARSEFWVIHYDLKEIETNIPPQISDGSEVKVWRRDLEPPAFDRVLWVVKQYDEENQRYLVSHPSGTKHSMMDRFTLELWQPQLLQNAKMREQLQRAKRLKVQMTAARKKLT